MQIIKNQSTSIKNYTNQQKSIGRLSGGGSQVASAMLNGDDEHEIQGDHEGMTQLRGEASKDQDKFRITVDREQRCYGFCDDTGDPVFEPGTTSVTFTGAHFRMSNVKWPEETWLKTEQFFVNGKLVTHTAGESVAIYLKLVRSFDERWSQSLSGVENFLTSCLPLLRRHH